MRAARSLPMPGISRSAAVSSAERSCGWLETISAPLRYARILNGLSFLISRRSAISSRIRAIAALSKPQSFCLDPVFEEPRAACGKRGTNRRLRFRRPVREKAAAAAGTADLGCRRARGAGARDQVVYGGRRDAGCEPFPVLPFFGDL